MAIHLSPYVHTPWTEIIDEKPPAPPEGSIVGCYYNVLFPLDTDHKSYLPFDSWILSHLAGDVSSFPLSDETVGLLGKNLFETGASRQVEICFAKAIEEQLQAGTPFSLEDALKKTEEKMKPAFEAMVAELEQKEQSSKGGLSVRYKTFKEAFIKASNLKETVQWMINKIEDTTRSQTLEELTDDFIKRGGPSNLRTNQGLFRLEDRWEFRKKPVMETIASIQKYAQDAPHFFAFQEVTPEILVDLKERFSDMQWISYNNLTGEETKFLSPEEEKIPQESTALTVTIALSKAWKIEKVAKLVWLSETPDVPSKIDGGAVIRPILGVVAIDPISSKKIVIINTHSDHFSRVPKVREVTSKVFNEFIDDVTEKRTIPYIAGGDLNVFESPAYNGQEYYEALKRNAGEYRDKKLFVPKEVQNVTFDGIPADLFKAKINQDGQFAPNIFEPNALDHIFYSKDSLDLQFGFRASGAYDQNGEIIDPYTDREGYRDALTKYRTASDHFANAIVVKA